MAEAAAKVGRAVDASTAAAMAKAGGKAAQKAALKAASASLGGDRKMSGLKKGGALNATVTGSGNTATVNFEGPWGLAEKGRRKSKTVRGQIFVIPSPFGPHWAFRSGPSRGLKTLTNAGQAAVKDAPKVAVDELEKKLGQVF